MQTADKLLCLGAKIRSQKYNEMSCDVKIIKIIITHNIEQNNFERDNANIVVPVGVRLSALYFILE